MRNLNQVGFSLVKGLLILVIAGVVGGTGYYVYSQNKDDDSSQQDAASSQAQTEEDDSPSTDQKEYKGRLVSFLYPKEWTVKGVDSDNIDEHIELTTKNYSNEEAPIGGTQVKEGAKVNLLVEETSAGSPRDVQAPYLRGSVLDSQMQSGKVEAKDVKIGENVGLEFTWQYEGDGYLVVEFVTGGLFVHAQLDTSGDETARAEYKQFIGLLSTLKSK